MGIGPHLITTEAGHVVAEDGRPFFAPLLALGRPLELGRQCGAVAVERAKGGGRRGARPRLQQLGRERDGRPVETSERIAVLVRSS